MKTGHVTRTGDLVQKLQAGHAAHHFADGLGLLHDLFGLARVFARKAGGNLPALD